MRHFYHEALKIMFVVCVCVCVCVCVLNNEKCK